MNGTAVLPKTPRNSYVTGNNRLDWR